MTRNSDRETSQDVEALEITSFSGGEQACGGQFAVGTAIAETDLAPLHASAERSFGAVVGRFDTIMFQESEQPPFVLEKRCGEIADLVEQYVRRTVDENCLYSTVTVGISLGRPLSPVMAAIYLEPLDRRMEESGLTYSRFMDDWLILAPTRWSLRRAVRIVNETLRELRVEQHPDKTFIGRIERGFTFLGYWITNKGVTGVAPSTWEAFQGTSGSAL